MLYQSALFQAVVTHGSHAVRVAVSQNKDNVESSKHISLHSKIFPTLHIANNPLPFSEIYLYYFTHCTVLMFYLFMYLTTNFQ